jgi:hypothetical protein
MFSDTGDQVVFRLSTSWIPGEDHQGRFRYKLDGTPKFAVEYPEPNQGEELLKRVQACTIHLLLYDRNEFELRTIQVQFIRAVNDQLKLSALNANQSVQMDVEEYRLFWKSDSSRGSWKVAWYCPNDPGFTK